MTKIGKPCLLWPKNQSRHVIARRETPPSGPSTRPDSRHRVVVQKMSYPGSSQGGSAAEHERDATNDDASDHAAPVRRRAPIYDVINVQRPSRNYRNQER